MRASGIASLLVVLGMAASLALTGCGKDSEDETKTFKIGFIAKASNNPVFQSAHEGAQAAAEKLSKENDVKVEVIIRTPSTEDASEQAKRIKELAEQGVDAIIISCSNADTCKAAIDDAAEKFGVPAMTFDSDSPDSKRFAFYGVDDIKTGEEVMDRLAKVMGEKGMIAILAGNPNALNLQTRTEGVRKALAKYPEMKLMDNGVIFHEEDPVLAAQKVRDVMAANPELQGWAMVGGWPLFSQSLLDLEPGRVKIVAVDALPAQLPYLEKGIAQVLLAQQVYEWGYQSVMITFRKVHKKETVPAMNEMALIPVTKDGGNGDKSIGQWAQQLKAWGISVEQKWLDMK